MIKQFCVSCGIFLALSGCTGLLDWPNRPRVFLENQQDHSGITVTVVEADTSVYTAADGSYTLPPLPDGTWTLRALYPWYSTAEQTFTIVNGEPTKPIADMTLKQEIAFEVSTDKSSYAMGDIVRITLISRNISERRVTLETTSGPMQAYAVRKNGQTIEGGLRPGVLTVMVEKAFQPGDVDTTYMDWNTSRYPPPGPGAYEIYAALTTGRTYSDSDTTTYWHYFELSYLVPPDISQMLSESLFSKLVPAIITLTQ